MSAAVDGLIGPLADASSVMKLDKDIHEASVQDSGGSRSGGAASIDGLLQLHPRQLEAELWCSPSAIKLLRAIDLICLTNSILITVLLLKTFASTWSKVQLLHTVVYGVVAVVQLLFMLHRRELYEQHRFRVTCVNRVLRILTLANACFETSTYTLRVRQMNMDVLTKSGSWSALLRMVVGIPLMYVNHANYVLPFAYVLPAQLLTFLAGGFMNRLLVCAMLQQPGMPLHLAQQLCQYMKLGMHYLGMLLTRPPGEASDAAAEQCRGLEGLVLLTVYADTVLVVMMPCLVVYFMELNLKMGFIRQRQLTLAHAPPGAVTRLGKAVMIHAAVVGSWLACEVLLLVITPLDCNSSSLLVRGVTSAV